MKNLWKLSKLSVVFWVLISTNSLVLGQTSQHILGEKQGISLSLVFSNTPKQSITPIYEERNDVNLSSKPSIGFEGSLKYRCFLAKRIGLELGVGGGTYPFDLRLFVSNDFSQVGFDITQISTTYDAVYLNMDIGVQYFFKLNDRRFFSAGATINLVYFLFLPFSEGVFVIPDTGGTVNIYRSQVLFNPDKKPFIAPEISFRFYQKVGQRFLLQLALFGVYSNKEPIVGRRYIISGPNEVLEGSFTKKYSHVGFDLGMTLLLNKKNKLHFGGT